MPRETQYPMYSTKSVDILRQIILLDEPYLSKVAAELDTQAANLQQHVDAMVERSWITRQKQGRRVILAFNPVKLWSGYDGTEPTQIVQTTLCDQIVAGRFDTLAEICAYVSGSCEVRTGFSPTDRNDSLVRTKQVRTDRAHGDPLVRLDLWDVGLPCNSCGESISSRFSSDREGNLLCWDCAIGSGAETDRRGVSQTTDPTKAVLSESALYHKNLCNYVINVATGCTHGCKFCYVPSTPNIKMRGEMLEQQADVDDGQREWGSYLLYRDDLPERLHRKLNRKQTWKDEKGGRGVVMISSGTDCYQDRRAAQITRGCVIELVNDNRPVRILTRSPAVARDIDVFQAADGLVTVGSSIPCLDDEQVRAIEPGAPAPSARLKALQELSDADIPVYVSMSPTYPTLEKEDVREMLEQFKSLDPDVIFHEPINPRGANFDMTVEAARQAGQDELADELAALQNRDRWVEYSVNQLEWVAEIGQELDLPIHLWPDKALLNHLDGEKKRELTLQRESTTSPETYPRPKPSA